MYQLLWEMRRLGKEGSRRDRTAVSVRIEQVGSVACPCTISGIPNLETPDASFAHGRPTGFDKAHVTLRRLHLCIALCSKLGLF